MNMRFVIAMPLLFALAVGFAVGCGDNGSQQSKPGDRKPTPPTTPAAASRDEESSPVGNEYCDFKGGPDNAPVRVVAYYPGRHEDTLAVVKGLLKDFPGKVQAEVVDWRTQEGLKRRAAAGLSCAGITINGENAFDLVVDAKPKKVLFVRGIDAEWTKADLLAAVQQTLAKAEGK